MYAHVSKTDQTAPFHSMFQGIEYILCLSTFSSNQCSSYSSIGSCIEDIDFYFLFSKSSHLSVHGIHVIVINFRFALL